MKFGQAPVQKYIDHLFEIVRDGKVVLDDIITHKIPLSDATRGYDMFKNKVDDCVKVVLKP
jgi:alcohol dehydrogenase